MDRIRRGLLSEADKVRLEVYGPELFWGIKREEDLNDHRLTRAILEEQGRIRRKRRTAEGRRVVVIGGDGCVRAEFSGVKACAECYGVKCACLKTFISTHRPYAAFHRVVGGYVQFRFDYDNGYGFAVQRKRGRP